MTPRIGLIAATALCLVLVAVRRAQYGVRLNDGGTIEFAL